MKIKQLSEILYKVYTNGQASSVGERLRENDISQLVLLTYGNLMRQRFIESKKLDEWGEPDYSFVSPILDVKEFELSDANNLGMRRADMKAYDLVRLPNNGHITNVYLIGNCGDGVGNISEVRNGEEGFYTTAEFNFFKFYSVIGRGVNTYNLPPCVKKIGVETTYSSDELDVSLDIGYEIGVAVLNLLFEEKKFPVRTIDNAFDANAVELKRNINNG